MLQVDQVSARFFCQTSSGESRPWILIGCAKTREMSANLISTAVWGSPRRLQRARLNFKSNYKFHLGLHRPKPFWLDTAKCTRSVAKVRQIRMQSSLPCLWRIGRVSSKLQRRHTPTQPRLVIAVFTGSGIAEDVRNAMGDYCGSVCAEIY